MCKRFVLTALAVLLAIPIIARGEDARAIYDRVRPCLVVVKYTAIGELARVERAGAGVVVREDGLVMCQLALMNLNVPDEQLSEFKILVPDPAGNDPEERDASLLARDERYGVAFLLPKRDAEGGAPKKWQAIKFEDVAVNVGDPVLSVGLLPEQAAYKAYLMQSAVAVTRRGDQPQVLVQTGLASVGSPVFSADGKAIGVVNFQPAQSPYLNDPSTALNAIIIPPKFFVPAKDFLPALAEEPAEGKTITIPWVGIPQSTGLNKDVAEVFDLKNRPAIQVGEVIEGAPAAKGGLERGDIIVEIDGQPLERGDEPDDLPSIFRRKIMQMKVGQKIKLGVLRAKGEPIQQIELTTEESPRRPHTAKRWFAEDLGFSSREILFNDTYARRLPKDAKGVIVALIRPQSASQSAGLQPGDMITDLNRTPVTDLESFRKSYEAFRKEKPKEAVVMVVVREGQTQTIRIEPPQ
jgi:serine protease Do